MTGRMNQIIHDSGDYCIQKQIGIFKVFEAVSQSIFVEDGEKGESMACSGFSIQM